MPKDLLTISVSCSEPEAALPFNLVVPASQTGINSTNLVSQPTLQNYLVNNQGEIVFPVLGTLKVGGMTTQETSELIVGKLERYLKERPIVTVRLVNYKISVIGEVSRPGVYTVNNEQVNVFEAVAMAGDLTIYGKRDNVHIIRTVDGKQKLITINLNDENIIYSPRLLSTAKRHPLRGAEQGEETECQHWFFHQSSDFHNLYTYIPGGVNGQYFTIKSIIH